MVSKQDVVVVESKMGAQSMEARMEECGKEL